MLRILALVLAIAAPASAQFLAPPARFIPVRSNDWDFLTGTNVQTALDSIDVQFPHIVTGGFNVLAPTSAALHVFAQYLDDHWPDRAGRIYAATNGWTEISGASSNLQDVIGSIDSNLAAISAGAYSTSNPSGFVTTAQVFAQPQVILFRSSTVVTQMFISGAAETDLQVVNATTSGPNSFVYTTNGMAHSHGISSDSVTVPTSGWYLVLGQIAGYLYGPQGSAAASFDAWILRDGARLDGANMSPGSRSWLQVYQTTNEIASLVGVNFRWFKQNGSAIVYAPTNNTFTLSGLCAGTAASAGVQYVSFEMRRIAP